MKKIAVFGKPGSGKSRLSRLLSAQTGLPLVQLDSLVFHPNGDLVDREVFDRTHQELLSSDQWIIDGFGPVSSFYQRLEAADTLVYIDLPYRISYWFVTKRFLKGLWEKPEGWPEGSSVIQGTINSYKTLKLCPKFWNNDFEQRLNTMKQHKRVHILRSLEEWNLFINSH